MHMLFFNLYAKPINKITVNDDVGGDGLWISKLN